VYLIPALMAFQLNDPIIVLTVGVSGKDSAIKKAFRNVQHPVDRHRKLTMNQCRNRFKTEEKVEEWRTRRAALLDAHKSSTAKRHLQHSQHTKPETEIAATYSIPSPYPNFRSVRLHKQELKPAKQFATLGFYQAQYEIHIRSRDQ
jgi:hypothetical protein